MRRIFPLALLGATLLGVAFAFASFARNGALVPPLDDAFIHFQYTELMAAGQPYAYIPNEGYSSGATSLLWPILLLPGLGLGLSGMGLYLWALLLGVLGMAGAATFTWRWLAKLADPTTATFGAVMVLGSGPLLWGAFSGMEIGVFACAMAAVLAHVDQEERVPLGLWLAVLAAIRPEGALMAAMAVVARAALKGPANAAPLVLGLLPGGVQPLLNLVQTGTIQGSSILAKQLPRMPHPEDGSALGYLWHTLLWDGYGGHFVQSGATAALLLFFVGAAGLTRHTTGRLSLGFFALPMLIMAFIIPLPVNHYRYLQPGLVVFVPAMALGAGWLGARLGSPKLLPVVAGLWLLNVPKWADELGKNARDIANQHVAMADWVAQHVPPEIKVGVNDAGFIPLLADRDILDLEGVVSRNSLGFARQGEGSLLSLLLQERPGLLILFPSWYPAIFQSGACEPMRVLRLEERTISGGSEMVACRPVPAVLQSGARPPTLAANEQVVDLLDVSDPTSEAEHHYDFDAQQPAAGRANALVLGRYEGEAVLDGARRHRSATSFVMRRTGGPARLIGRFGPSEAATLAVVPDGGRALGIQLPTIAEGQWLDVALELPASGNSSLGVDVVPVEIATGSRGGWLMARWWLVEASGS